MAKEKKEINKHTFCLLGFEAGLFVVFPKRADTHTHTRGVAQEHPSKPSTDKTQPPSAKLRRVPVKSSSICSIHTSRICVLMRMYGIPATDRCPPAGKELQVSARKRRRRCHLLNSRLCWQVLAEDGNAHRNGPITAGLPARRMNSDSTGVVGGLLTCSFGEYQQCWIFKVKVLNIYI